MKKNNQLRNNLTRSEVRNFIEQIEATKIGNHSGGRLIFAMDATASRQPAWDRAAHIQSEMFVATSKIGGLEVQLAFFRGFKEFKVSKWTNQSTKLLSLMSSVTCAAGETQIGKVLQHALNQTQKTKLNAVIFVGDSMEEDIDQIGRIAGELGLYGVPVFMFQEGGDPLVNFAYNEIAKLTGGACVSFDAGSVEVLRELLKAVAVFAAGGKAELNKLPLSGKLMKKLTQQIGKN